MAKWQDAPIVEQPKWMDAPVVEPEPQRANPWAGVNLTGRGVPSPNDVKAMMVARPKEIAKLHDQTGLDYGTIGEIYGATDALGLYSGPKQQEHIQKEIGRRQYAGFFDELATAFGAFKLKAGRAALDIVAAAGKLAQDVPSPYRGATMSAGVNFEWEKAKAEELNREARSMKYQPGEGGGVLRFTAQVLGNVVPYAGLSMLAGLVAGPVGAFGIAATIEGDDLYREALADGASDTEAAVAGTVGGAAVGLLEVLQLNKLVKFAKAAKPTVMREFSQAVGQSAMQKLGTAAGAITRQQVETAVQEGFVETLQGWAAEGTAAVVYGKDVDAGELVKNSAMDFAGGAIGSVLLSPVSIVLRGDTPTVEGQAEPPKPAMVMTEDEYAAYEASQAQTAATEGAGVSPVAETVPAAPVAEQVLPIQQGVANAEGVQPQSPAVEQGMVEGGVEYTQAVNALKASLAKAKRIAPVIKTEQSEELSKRVGAASGTLESLLSKGVPAREAVRRSTGMLRGQLAEYEQRYEAIRDQLGEPTVEFLQRGIATDPKLKYFEKDTMGGLLDKLLDGAALTYHQARLLGDYYGKEIGNAAVGRVSPGDRFWFLLMEALNLPRTALASIDQSGILRQARALGQANPKEYAQMVVKYQQAFFSEENAQRIEAEYKKHPVYKEAKRVGLEMPEFGRIDVDINELSEQFMAARLLQKIPGVRASERSFVTALNWMRLSVYDKLVNQTEAMRGTPLTTAEKKNLARVINNLSGRSSLPQGLKALAPILNAAFFSPRFALSRFALPKDIVVGGLRSMGEIGLDANGKYQLKLRKELQPELALAIKATASMVATNLAIIALVQLVTGPDDDVEMEADPRATGFGKIRVGKFRLDLWAGYAQAARFVARLGTGQVKTATGEIREQDRRDTLKDFLQSKESPLASLFIDAMQGQDQLGKPFGAAPKGPYGKLMTGLGIPKGAQGVAAETLSRITPLIIQDTLDAMILEGVPEAVTALGLGFFGAGVQTYDKSENQVAAEMKNTLAQRDYGRKWNDLKMSEQLDLRERESIIGDLERVARREAYPVTNIDRTEEANAGQRIYDGLSEPVRKALNEAGVRTDLTRVISKGLWLNEKRWQEYQRRAGESIESAVSSVLPDLKGMNEAERSEATRQVVTRARANARNSLLQDIEDGKL